MIRMKLTAQDARTYYDMMCEREHTKSRTERIGEFLKNPHCEDRTVIISLNVRDVDYFKAMLSEDDKLSDEGRDLCQRMCKEYEDYANAKRARKSREDNEPHGLALVPMPGTEQLGWGEQQWGPQQDKAAGIRKGDRVRIIEDGTEYEVISGTKKPDGYIKIKTDDGARKVSASEVEVIK